mgnify:CR=1 FL=1
MSAEDTEVLDLHEIALPDGTHCSILWRKSLEESFCCGSGRFRFFFVSGSARFLRGMMRRIETLSFPPEKSGPWRVRRISQIAEKAFRIEIEHPEHGERNVVCAVRSDRRRRSIGVQTDRTLNRIQVTLPGAPALCAAARRLGVSPCERSPPVFLRGRRKKENVSLARTGMSRSARSAHVAR